MSRAFLPRGEPQLSACCSNSCAAPARRPGGGRWERMWMPYMAARREKCPPCPPRLPGQSAGSSATCLPQRLTFPSCPRPQAEPPFTPRPKASGLKTARLLSPESATGKEGAHRCPDSQPLCVWVCGVCVCVGRRGGEAGLLGPRPSWAVPADCLGSCEGEGACET